MRSFPKLGHIAEPTVHGWMKLNFDEMKHNGQNLSIMKRQSGGGRKLSYPISVDNDILALIMNMRDKQQAVTIELILIHGKKLILPHNLNFVASCGWAKKFCNNTLLP